MGYITYIQYISIYWILVKYTAIYAWTKHILQYVWLCSYV